MNEPFEIGVVTACYKGERTLAATLAAMRGQTHRAWRQVVVDDGSPDGVAEVAARFAAEDDRIELVRTPNQGVCAARNLGFARLPETVRYVMFLDQDDVPGADALARLAEVLERHPGAAMAHCEPRLIDADGREKSEQGWMPRWARGRWRWWPRALPPEEDGTTPFEAIYCLAGALPSLSLYRREALVEAGLYDVELGQCCEDVNLNIGVALRGEVRHVAERLVGYRLHAAQVSADGALQARQEERLYRKWTTRDDLDAGMAARVEAAERFRRGAVALRVALILGKRELRAGRWRAFGRRAGEATRALGYV